MGWNSWDGFATTVTEAQTRAQADFMAANLHRHGWEFIVVDIQWYEPRANGFDYRKGAKLEMDKWGRLLPATNKFPSAINGRGFKPLADYVHSLGLKFGVHLMRGIPRQAVAAKTRIKGAHGTAADIADTNSICLWNSDMYGVDMSRTGAQEYYDSVFELFASWGLDFVKVDDLSRPYHEAEIEAIRRAIDLRPGDCVQHLAGRHAAQRGRKRQHQRQHVAYQRRFLGQVGPAFSRNSSACAIGRPFAAPGHFPDADMLPIGVLQMGKNKTHFTHDEQFTLMSLWSIARSPLMIGADITKLDDFTLSLLTNDEVIAVNQKSANNRELFHRDGFCVWVADVPGSADKYIAFFNTRAPGAGEVAAAIPVKLSELGLGGKAQVRDLWLQKNLGPIADDFAPVINAHGAGLYRLSPAGGN